MNAATHGSRRTGSWACGTVAIFVLVGCGGGIPSASSAGSVSPTATTAPAPEKGRVPASTEEACVTLATGSRADRIAAFEYLPKRTDAIIDEAKRTKADLGPEGLRRLPTDTRRAVEQVTTRYWAPPYRPNQYPYLCITENSNPLPRIAMAEREVKRARVFADEYLAEKKVEEDAAAARKKKAEEARVAAAAAKDFCEKDVVKCKEICAKNAGAYECFVIGLMYEVGDKRIGIAVPDYKKALSTYWAGCEASNPYMCVAKDSLNKQANTCSEFESCKLFCEAGAGVACNNAGQMYLDGNGVPRSTSLAATFFVKACDAKEIDGCQRMAIAHFKGWGVPKSDVAALGYLKKACALGAGVSCNDHKLLCSKTPGCVPLAP